MLNAPKGNGLKAKRDRAILSALFYHAVRRAELCSLTVRDLHDRKAVKHFRIHGNAGIRNRSPLTANFCFASEAEKNQCSQHTALNASVPHPCSILVGNVPKPRPDQRLA
jgi:integrase